MKQNSPMILMFKTYEFIAFRFIVSAASVVPLFWSFGYGMKRLKEFFGIDLFITDMLYGYVGLVLGMLYINGVRRLLIHLIGHAHVAALSGLLWKDVSAGTLSYGFKTLFSRIGSASVMFAVDKVLTKATLDISKWVVANTDMLPKFLKQGLFSSIVKNSLKQVILNLAEAIMAYLYRNKEVQLWDGILKGAGLYVLAWKDILKASFLNTIYLKLFSWGFTLVVLAMAVPFLWGKDIQFMVTVFLTYKILIWIIRMSVVEPYITASMLVGFHKGTMDKEPDEMLLSKLGNVSDSIATIIKNRGSAVDDVASEIAVNLQDNLPLDLDFLDPLKKIMKVSKKGGSSENAD